jgi:hypothetical protein
MELPQGEEKRMKKEREDEERERELAELLAGQSRRRNWHDWSHPC